ncbi:MAG TPA: EamA family transporter [Candidatus Sulfotelmatobacter sp.]|jgi:drug/metabolite transporter (DMT)-like permease|nr:EamA family transporter [Candidatus Sulfotelmatobacter sp.]
MSRDQPSQIMAVVRSRKLKDTKLINIGGRPVIVSKSNTPSIRLQRAESIKLALAFAAIYLVWGSTYLAIRYAVETIPPLVAAGIRHTIAGGVLLAWACARGYRPRREHWIAGIVLGALFFFVGHGTLHWAEQHVASGLAALLIATEPMFILVLAWLSGQQRISRISALGLAFGVVGVAILTGAEVSAKNASLIGLLAVLLGSLSWSAGVVISPKLKLPTDALARTAVPLVCGAVMLLATAGITGEFHGLHWSAISLKSIFGLGYLIVFGSIVAFTAYTWLLQRVPPAVVATHTYANPVVAVLLGWLLASEPLTARVAIASVAILGAIMLIRRGERTTVRPVASTAPVKAKSSAQVA